VQCNYGKRSDMITAAEIRVASIRQRGKKWHVEVYRLGVRRAKTFDNKRAANHWAIVTENEITAQHERGEFDATGPGVRTVRDLFDRYLADVTPGKRGARNEAARLKALMRDPLASVALSAVAAPDIAAWRDRRLNVVAPSSVARDMNLLVSVFWRAVKEWQWLSVNPCTGVVRPKEPPPRERRVTDKEIEALGFVVGLSDGVPTTTAQRVYLAFLFAIETAMRASEICGLTAGDIKGSVARLNLTKNGYGRDVPLSPAALAILARLPAGGDTVFGLKAGQVDALFRKYRDKAVIADLHFHDSRHEAISRLALKIDVLDLARMTGHRDIRMLMRYYHRSASDVAGQLAG
jgi:integrase